MPTTRILQVDGGDFTKAVPPQKDPVRLATTANHGLTGLAAIDGVTPVADDRILVRLQTTGAQNGIYKAAAGAWVRDDDAPAGSTDLFFTGTSVRVLEGTVNGGRTFYISTTGQLTIGTTATTWVDEHAYTPSIKDDTAKTATFTAVIGETHVVDLSGGNFTANLPPVADANGRIGFYISSTGGQLTLDPNASEQIEGKNTVKISRGHNTIENNGTEWRVTQKTGRFDTRLDPVQITADQNPYNPTDWGSDVTIMYIDSDAERTINGFEENGFVDMQTVIVVNDGSFNILITHDTSTTAADRVLIEGGETYTLPPNGMITLLRDGTANRWRLHPVKADAAAALTQTNAVYVSEAGADSNDGTDPSRPKATIASAITQAGTMSPSATNRIAIIVQDAGHYDCTNLDLSTGRDLYAPHATLEHSGLTTQWMLNITGDDQTVHIGRVNIPGSVNSAGLRIASGDHCYLRVDEFNVTSTTTSYAIAVLSGSTVATIDVGHMIINAGKGVHVQTGQPARVRGSIDEIEITGAGTGVQVDAGDSVNDHGGQLRIGKIHGSSGTAFTIAGTKTVVDAFVGTIDCDTAYTVSSNAIFNLFAGVLKGSENFSGTGAAANVSTAGRPYMTNRTLVHKDQLEVTGGGLLAIKQAGIFYFASGINPSENDTFVLTDGTTTETWTFKATPAGAFDVDIGASIITTTTNLRTAINNDSTLWDAVYVSSIAGDPIGSLAGFLVIYRTNATNADDRMHGSFATGAPRTVNFNGERDYSRARAAWASVLPSSDPSEKQFGYGNTGAGLDYDSPTGIHGQMFSVLYGHINEGPALFMANQSRDTVQTWDEFALTTPTLYLQEQSAADSDRAGWGQIWVKDDAPNTLYFTDDTGTDWQLNVTSGDVSGPGSSTDNAIARFDLATGKLIQNSGVTISDTNEMAGAITITMPEQSTAPTPAAGEGVFWVEDTTPSMPAFSDDLSRDFQLRRTIYMERTVPTGADEYVEIGTMTTGVPTAFWLSTGTATTGSNPDLAMYFVAFNQFSETSNGGLDYDILRPVWTGIGISGNQQGQVEMRKDGVNITLRLRHNFTVIGTYTQQIRIYPITPLSFNFTQSTTTGTATAPTTTFRGTPFSSYWNLGGTGGTRFWHPIFLDERAAAPTATAGVGSLWVRNDTPNLPIFTDDAGTDMPLAIGMTNVVYVAAGGNDSNSGSSPTTAKATITSAITAANALSPSVSNPVTVHVLDAEIYTPSANLTFLDYVSLYAPDATIDLSTNRTISVQDQVTFRCKTVLSSNVSGIFTQVSTTDTVWIRINRLEQSVDSAVIFNNITGGNLHLDIDYLDAAGCTDVIPVTGTASLYARIGEATFSGGSLKTFLSASTTGEIHLDIDYLHSASSEVAFERTSGTPVAHVRVGNLDMPNGSYTWTSGTLYLNVGIIDIATRTSTISDSWPYNTVLEVANQAWHRGGMRGNVRLATTANVTLSGGAPNSLDGFSVFNGDRILVKDQTTTSQNGIYEVSDAGTGSDGTWVRAGDMRTGYIDSVRAGDTVYVVFGGTNGDTYFYVDAATDAPINVGGEVMTWGIFIGSSGDVTGPASSVSNALALFNGTTGKIIKGGAASNNVILDTSGNLTPEVNDGGSLGTVSLSWSDLFLASGGQAFFGDSTTYIQGQQGGGANDMVFRSTDLMLFQLEATTTNHFVMNGGDGSFSIREITAASSPAGTAAYGSFWVENTAPNIPRYTDDAGNAFHLARITTATTNPTTGDDSADGYVVGSRWINTTEKLEWVCVDATAAAAVWKLTDKPGIEARKSTATAFTTATDIVFNGTAYADHGFSLASGVVTITYAGLYRIEWDLLVQETGGTNLADWEVYVQRDTGGGYAVVTQTRGGDRSLGGRQVDASRTYTTSFTAGDDFKLTAERVSGTGTPSVVATTVTFRITRIG